MIQSTILAYSDTQSLNRQPGSLNVTDLGSLHVYYSCIVFPLVRFLTVAFGALLLMGHFAQSLFMGEVHSLLQLDMFEIFLGNPHLPKQE